MYDAKLSSRSVIHDSAGFADRTMAEARKTGAIVD